MHHIKVDKLQIDRIEFCSTLAFCSSTTLYFCSTLLHLLYQLLRSVLKQAAMLVSGVLASLPLLPRVLISSSSLLMLSELRKTQILWFKWSLARYAGVVYNPFRFAGRFKCSALRLCELEVRCVVNHSRTISIQTLTLQTKTDKKQWVSLIYRRTIKSDTLRKFILLGLLIFPAHLRGSGANGQCCG